MFCPKCKYTSFDHLDSCPSCGHAWEEPKKRLNLDWLTSYEANNLANMTGGSVQTDNHPGPRLEGPIDSGPESLQESVAQEETAVPGNREQPAQALATEEKPGFGQEEPAQTGEHEVETTRTVKTQPAGDGETKDRPAADVDLSEIEYSFEDMSEELTEQPGVASSETKPEPQEEADEDWAALLEDTDIEIDLEEEPEQLQSTDRTQDTQPGSAEPETDQDETEAEWAALIEELELEADHRDDPDKTKQTE